MGRTLRFTKDGKKVYEITVFLGVDPLTGKRKTYSQRWAVPENYSDKKADKEASIIESDLIAKGKRGELLTKREQKQQELKTAKETEQSKYEYNCLPTVKEYIDSFITHKSAEVSLGTIVNIRVILDRFSSVYGDFKIPEITKTMMRKYTDELFGDSGKCYETCDNYFSIVRSMFDQAVEDGILEDSPMTGIKRPRKKKDFVELEREKAYSESQLIEILDIFKKNEPFKWFVIALLMADTGMREGEIAGLKWDHIDFETGNCCICNNVQYTQGIGVYEKTPKNGKLRTIYINEYPLSVLKHWHEIQKLENLYKYGVSKSAVFCFEYEVGKPMPPHTIYTRFQRFGKKYNIPDFHPHKLRHTMATIMIANDADIVSVSKKLGHSKPSITLNTYSHANKEAQQRANEKFVNAVYSNMEMELYDK